MAALTIVEAQSKAIRLPSFKEHSTNLSLSLAKNPLRKERMSHFIQNYG
jgi:hypothetical protein